MTENKKNLLAGFKCQLKAALLIQGVELLIFLKASYKVVGKIVFKSHNIIRLLILHSERPRVFPDKCAGPY